MREQLAQTPVADIVANHAIGLWELAILHLSPEDGNRARPRGGSARHRRMAALVEGLGDRLGPHEEPLRDALAQLRLAFVEIEPARRVG